MCDLHVIYGCHGNVKYHGHTVDISKFPRKMNKLLQKVLASSRVNPLSSFSKEKKKLFLAFINIHYLKPSFTKPCILDKLPLPDNTVSICSYTWSHSMS